MGCITTTYLDRLIAWYVGIDQIEKCFNKFDSTCMKDLALYALKRRVLKKSPCNSFAPGTASCWPVGGPNPSRPSASVIASRSPVGPRPSPSR